MTEYTLTVSAEQLRIIQCACEDYLRTRMGQFIDLTDDMAFAGYDHNKGSDIEFQDRITRRNAARELMDGAARIVMVAKYPGTMVKTQDMLIAEDIWQVIRHARYLERPAEEQEQMKWCRDADDPFLCSREPAVIVRRADKCANI